MPNNFQHPYGKQLLPPGKEGQPHHIQPTTHNPQPHNHLRLARTMVAPSFPASVLLLAAAAAGVTNAFSLTTLLPTTRSYTVTEVPVDYQEQPATTPLEDSNNHSIGERIKSGKSIILIKDLVSHEECTFLIEEVLRQDASPTSLEKPGLVRIPTRAAAERAAKFDIPCADPLSADVDNLLYTILKRATSVMDDQIPSISEVLFGGESVCHLLHTEQLKFSSREPAINIYTPGGQFLAHKDAQAITVLIPLSCPEQHFQGGGTSFWSQDSRGHRVEDPTIILKPSSVSAMLFGGCVTHAGVSVEDGTRVVFVASFSSISAEESPVVVTEHRDIYGDSL